MSPTLGCAQLLFGIQVPAHSCLAVGRLSACHSPVAGQSWRSAFIRAFSLPERPQPFFGRRAPFARRKELKRSCWTNAEAPRWLCVDDLSIGVHFAELGREVAERVASSAMKRFSKSSVRVAMARTACGVRLPKCRSWRLAQRALSHDDRPQPLGLRRSLSGKSRRATSP